MAVTQRLQDASGIIAADEIGDTVFLVGDGAPTDGRGFAPGCIYRRSAGSGTTDLLYVNTAVRGEASTFASLTIN